MTEQTKTYNTIGQARLNWLIKASEFYASGNIDVCLGYIDAFRRTLITGNKAAKDLNDRRNEIEQEMKDGMHKLDEKIKQIGFPEGKDIYDKKSDVINLKAIDDLLEACWNISQEEELFHE